MQERHDGLAFSASALSLSERQSFLSRVLANMSDRVVLIAGAKGGLGSFITERFLSTGATVVGASRSISRQDFPQANFAALPVDFTKPSEVTGAAVPIDEGGA